MKWTSNNRVRADSANMQFLFGGSDEPRWNRDGSQHGFTSIWPSSTQKPRYSLTCNPWNQLRFLLNHNPGDTLKPPLYKLLENARGDAVLDGRISLTSFARSGLFKHFRPCHRTWVTHNSVCLTQLSPNTPRSKEPALWSYCFGTLSENPKVSFHWKAEV